jgi:hypothetical protein
MKSSIMENMLEEQSYLDRYIRSAEILDEQIHALPNTDLGKDVWLHYRKIKYPTGEVVNGCNIYSTSKKTGWDLPTEFNYYMEDQV